MRQHCSANARGNSTYVLFGALFCDQCPPTARWKSSSLLPRNCGDVYDHHCHCSPRQRLFHCCCCPRRNWATAAAAKVVSLSTDGHLQGHLPGHPRRRSTPTSAEVAATYRRRRSNSRTTWPVRSRRPPTNDSDNGTSNSTSNSCRTSDFNPLFWQLVYVHRSHLPRWRTFFDYIITSASVHIYFDVQISSAPCQRRNEWWNVCLTCHVRSRSAVWIESSANEIHVTAVGLAITSTGAIWRRGGEPGGVVSQAVVRCRRLICCSEVTAWLLPAET